MSKGYKRFRIVCGAIALALLIAMWFFSSQTGEESGRLSNAIARFLMRLIHMEESKSNLARVGHIVRKAAHFNLFALLGAALGFAFAPPSKPARAFWAMPLALLSATADEFHQTFVAARAGMWQDSLLDSCGALTGVTAAFVILLLAKRRQGRKQKLLE